MNCIYVNINAAGNVNYYHNDYPDGSGQALSSACLITDANCEVVWRRDYQSAARPLWGYPFGSDKDAGGSGNDYKFTGKVEAQRRSRPGGKWDEESDLYYFWHRYYDPSTGRFIQVDPMWDKSPELTSYHYCRNNPLRYFDPDGEEELEALRASSDYLGLRYGIGLNYYDNGKWEKPSSLTRLVCNEFVAVSYWDAGYKDFPGPMDKQVEWFRSREWFTTDRNAGELGDVMFLGDVNTPGKRHVVIISGMKLSEVGEKLYRVRGASWSKNITKDYGKYKSLEELEEWFGKIFYGIGSVQRDRYEEFDMFYISFESDNTGVYFEADFK